MDGGMKFAGAVASFLTCIDTVRMAAGLEPQGLFSSHALWVWWVVAVGWLVVAGRFVWSLCKD